MPFANIIKRIQRMMWWGGSRVGVFDFSFAFDLQVAEVDKFGNKIGHVVALVGAFAAAHLHQQLPSPCHLHSTTHASCLHSRPQRTHLCLLTCSTRQLDLDHVCSLPIIQLLRVFWIKMRGEGAGVDGTWQAGGRGGEGGVGDELGGEGVMGIKVEAGGEPGGDGGVAELAHEDVPVVEVGVKCAVGEGCVGEGVLRVLVRKWKTRASGQPGKCYRERKVYLQSRDSIYDILELFSASFMIVLQLLYLRKTYAPSIQLPSLPKRVQRTPSWLARQERTPLLGTSSSFYDNLWKKVGLVCIEGHGMEASQWRMMFIQVKEMMGRHVVGWPNKFYANKFSMLQKRRNLNEGCSQGVQGGQLVHYRYVNVLQQMRLQHHDH